MAELLTLLVDKHEEENHGIPSNVSNRDVARMDDDCPQAVWRKLRTTNAIERCFVEVRRRTRPMVLFVNAASVERIIYAIFRRFNQQWQNRTLRLLTQAA